MPEGVFTAKKAYPLKKAIEPSELPGFRARAALLYEFLIGVQYELKAKIMLISSSLSPSETKKILLEYPCTEKQPEETLILFPD